jgi:glycosyltransferase involved in cell wall biosynthesis
VTVLFVSYTAVSEPLGQSQVLPYVRGLARRGFRMRLASFEKRNLDAAELERIERSLRDEGIAWRRLAYHAKPRVASTAYDIARGVALCFGGRGERIDLIHARSHVPALMADLATRMSGAPYVFDHRGLMAEEYADSGLWPRGGWLYRVVSRLEARFLRRAAGVVVLTERYRDELGPDPRIEVIPCAVDLSVFRPTQDPERPYDLVYAGSWSGLYLADEMLRFFSALRCVRPHGRFLVLAPPGQPLPVPGNGVEAIHATPDQVPRLLTRARAGVSLRRPGRAQVAAAPVKVSEYLASGLPVVSSAGVGDLDTLLPSTGTGVLLQGFSDGDMYRAAAELARLIDLGRPVVDRCRRLAEKRYSLEIAIDNYAAVYRRVLASRGSSLT